MHGTAHSAGFLRVSTWHTLNKVSKQAGGRDDCKVPIFKWKVFVLQIGAGVGHDKFTAVQSSIGMCQLSSLY